MILSRYQLSVQFDYDSLAEVDSVLTRPVAAGNEIDTEPQAAFWDQRFARVTDPDGRIVHFYAQL